MESKLKIKHILAFAFFLAALTDSFPLFAQCPQNNFTVAGFQLRNSSGNVFTVTDNYVLGQPVTGELWVIFGGSTTNGYNMLMYYDIFVNGTMSSNDEYNCLFSGTQVVQNVWVKVRNLTWNWGDLIEIRDIFMYWETGTAKANTTCVVSSKSNINSQCYGNPSGFAAVVPLYPNFTFNTVCSATSAINFTNNTTGGTPGYTYSWNFGGQGTSSLKDPSFTFSQPGNYNVSLTVTDSQTPTKTVTTVSKTVSIPDPITISATTTSTQLNGSTGSINVTVTGGTAPYSYLWTFPNGSTRTTKDISSIPKGTYTLLVTDALGCTNTEQFVIYDLLTSDFTFASTQCNSRIQFTSTTAGGTPPLNYTYEWDFNNDGTPDSNLANPIFDFLSSGSYPVTLIVRNGTSSITINKTVFIDPNFGIQVTIFPTKKSEESGEIYVESVTGGTPPYTYYWTGPNGFLSTNKDIFNLKVGLYQLVVTDTNGCQQTEQYEMDIASVLNLEWKSFELELKGDLIKVIWEMNSESFGTEYVIQRSFGNISNFESITTVKSQNPGQNAARYEYQDKKFSRFEEYIYYRIEKRQGGTSQYSEVKMVKLENLTPCDTWLVYPNPSAGGNFNLRYEDPTLSEGGEVTLVLFDAGNFSRKVSIQVRSGHTLKLPDLFGPLPKGILFLRIQKEDQVKTIKLLNTN
jgi:PKD repeat protein